MKRTAVLLRTIPLLAIIVTCLTACPSNEQFVEELSKTSYYFINANMFEGAAAVNTTLHAIELPSKTNNMLRMYYSDSAAKMGFPASMNIVSYGRAGKLRYHECYFEISTSATDTYLSFPSTTDTATVRFDSKKFTFGDTRVQHWTSVPLNEFTNVSGNLIIK